MKCTGFDESLAAYLTSQHSGHDDPLLRELREITQQFGDDAVMEIPDNQGTLLTMLTSWIAPRAALEIGTFTGHSSICIARGLPSESHLWCLDANPTWTAVAQTFWQRAGLDDRITLVLGDALATLDQLDPNLQFDFVHIDAEKTLYESFYEKVLPRVPAGGLLLFDNMLLRGEVLSDDPSPRAAAIARFNTRLTADPRVENVLVPIGDGIQLCRRK